MYLYLETPLLYACMGYLCRLYMDSLQYLLCNHQPLMVHLLMAVCHLRMVALFSLLPECLLECLLVAFHREAFLLLLVGILVDMVDLLLTWVVLIVVVAVAAAAATSEAMVDMAAVEGKKLILVSAHI